MKWINVVILFDSVASSFIGLLLVRTLRKKDKNPAEWSLVLMFAAQLTWICSDLFGSVLAIYLPPAFQAWGDLLGGGTGIGVTMTVYGAYLFCELYPEPGKYAWSRIAAFSLTALPFCFFAFTPHFIGNRRVVDGVKVGDQGLAFVVLGIWATAAILGGLGILIHKYSRLKIPRLRTNIRLFVLGILINLVLVLITSYIMPLLGLGTLNFIGPFSSLVLISVLMYAVSFHGLFNLEGAAISWILHLGFSLIPGAVFYWILTFLIPGGHSMFIWIAFVILFLTGLPYGRYVVPRLDRLLKREPADADELLLRILSGRAFDPGGLTLEELLEKLTEALAANPGNPRVMIIAFSPYGEPVVARKGEFGGLERRLPTDALARLNGRRLPEFLLSALDHVFLLEQTHRDRIVPELADAKYPRVGAAITRFLEILTENEIAVLTPLILSHRVGGYVLLGQKANGKPFYHQDLKLLDKIRVSIALAVRNFNYYEQIRGMRNRAEAEVEKLTEFISTREAIHERVHGRSLLYTSPLMEEVVRKCNNAAAMGAKPVLIHGETGTGKELIARMIHQSQREGKPFVAVNCAAVPASLWEDDIFGHVRGAFTDARNTRAGKVEEAGDGTLFFDEIGEMPLEMQAKMLRLLQERVYTPIGGSKTMNAQCRFMFATNRDLEERIEAGEFRRDLFYRINVFAVELPPLRNRGEDIPILVNHFVEKFAAELGSTVTEIEGEAVRALMRHDWPGNIRELENVVIRSLAGAQGSVLSVGDLPGDLSANAGRRPGVVRAPARDRPTRVGRSGLTDGNFKDLVNDYRKSLIQEALKKFDGNKTKTAEFLGLKRTTLYSQIEELEISE